MAIDSNASRRQPTARGDGHDRGAVDTAIYLCFGVIELDHREPLVEQPCPSSDAASIGTSGMHHARASSGLRNPVI